MTDSPKTPRRYSHRRQLSKIKSEPRRRSSGFHVPSSASPETRVSKYGNLGSPGGNGSPQKARILSQSTGLAKLMLVEMNRDLNKQFEGLGKLRRIDSGSERDCMSVSGSTNGVSSSAESIRSDVSQFTNDPNVTEEDILKTIAAKQRRVLDLKTELALAEREITTLSDKYSSMVTRRTIGTSESAADPRSPERAGILSRSPSRVRGPTPVDGAQDGLLSQLKRSSTFKSVRESIGMGRDDDDMPTPLSRGISPRRESRRQSMLPNPASPYAEPSDLAPQQSPRLSIAKKKSLMFRAQRAFQQQQPSLKLKHSSQQLKQSIQNQTDELLIKGHRFFNDIAKEFMSSDDDDGTYDWNEDSDIDEEDFGGPVERL